MTRDIPSPRGDSPPRGDPVDLAESGSLVTEAQKFAVIPEWVIDADLSDAAFRVYALLLRYGNGSGWRMPSRRLLADRLHRSVDSVDRAMRELTTTGVVRIERRRHGKENLTNRYHVRTSDPSGPQTPGKGRGRTSAATPARTHPGGRGSAATPGRIVAATLAADLRPDREISTDTPPPPTPSSPQNASSKEEVDATARLLAECDITDLDALAARCAASRRGLGQPATRWARPCLLAVIQVAVKARGWPPELVVPALLAVAADPSSRSPMRLAEAGPWWDQLPASNGQVRVAGELPELEDRLAATDGHRVHLQAQARTELAGEGEPVTRLTVAARACEILDRPVAG